MKSVLISEVRIVWFLCLFAGIAVVEGGIQHPGLGGFWGSRTAFLGMLQKEKVVEEPLVNDKIAAAAEAEAWALFTKKQQGKVNSTAANSTVRPEADQALPEAIAKGATAKSNAAAPLEIQSKPKEPQQQPKPQKRSRSREGNLIASLSKADPDAVDCMTHCRYGEEIRHHWTECLDRCVENPLMRQSFVKMLPDEHHAEKDLDHEMPHGLELPTPEQLKRATEAIKDKKETSSEPLEQTKPQEQTKAQKRTRSREGHLINSLAKADPEAVVCMTHCRYGEEVRHHWTECLDRCVENVLMRQTFVKMLPDEHHAEKDLDHAMPDGLEKPTPEQLKRIKHKRNKSSEL